MNGMQTRMLYPEVETFDCELCRSVVCDTDGKPHVWAGQQIPRRGPPPCECNPPGHCKKLDLGLEAFTPASEEIFRRYRMGRAVGFTEAEINSEQFREDCSLLHEAELHCNRVLLSWSMWGKKDAGK